jgi:hypothetical protein
MSAGRATVEVRIGAGPTPIVSHYDTEDLLEICSLTSGCQQQNLIWSFMGIVLLTPIMIVSRRAKGQNLPSLIDAMRLQKHDSGTRWNQ